MPPGLAAPFLMATSVSACAPGPGMIYVATPTMEQGGALAVRVTSLALHLASYPHIGRAAFGTTVLLAASRSLLVAVKLAACYSGWGRA
jgi:threonine/homoserine/homoserine lactone efflux protein